MEITNKHSSITNVIMLVLNIVFIMIIFGVGIGGIAYKAYGNTNNVRSVEDLELDDFSIECPSGDVYYVSGLKYMSFYEVIDYFTNRGFVKQPAVMIDKAYNDEFVQLEDLLTWDVDDIFYKVANSDEYRISMLHDEKNDIDLYVLRYVNERSHNYIGLRFIFNASEKYNTEKDKYVINGLNKVYKFKKESILDEDYYDNTGKMGIDLVDGSDIFDDNSSYTLHTSKDQCTYMVWRDFVSGD